MVVELNLDEFFIGFCRGFWYFYCMVMGLCLDLVGGFWNLFVN